MRRRNNLPDGYLSLPWGEVVEITRVLKSPGDYPPEVIAACRLAEEARRKAATTKEKAPAA